ncbi:MAG: phosphatase PAP2 family protein [Butyrivibrio sp.]|nr:phosphatase PAP2 family protein [Butyrivibrio sp.]
MKNIFERLVGRKVDKDYFKDVFRMAMPLLMYGALYIIWFSIIEKHRFSHYAVIHTAIDDSIPFVEAFIVPYYLWFFYVALTLVFFLLTLEIEDYYRNFLFLITGMTLFLIISTLFPNIHHLRPAVMPRDNVFTKLVVLIYSKDTPTNIWPSIHVYNSIGTMIAIQRSKKTNSIVKILSNILAVLIILSTMFVKQHSAYDVVTAIAMAIIFYLVFYKSSFMEAFCRRREEKLAFRYE